LGISLRFILAANAGSSWSVGKLVQFDGNGTAKGTLELQDPTQFSLSGTYVFRASGIDSGDQPFDNGSPQPMGQVGIFTVDGSGGITAGNVDTNDFGNLSVFVPVSPSPSSSYSVDSNGRGTLTLATSSGTSNFVMYVVDSQHVNFMATDSLPSLLGRAESQAPQTFTTSNLNGGYAFLVDRPVVVGVNGFDRREFAQVGAYRFDGVGGLDSVTGARDDTNNTDNNGINLNPLVDITGGYSVTATGGRGTFDARSDVQGSDRGYVFYMLSDDKMFLLQTVNFSNGTLNAPVGVAEKQVGGPYSDATLAGNYALDASDLTATYTEALMRLSFDGSGGVGGIADVSAGNAVSSAVISADLNPAPGPSTGRGGITLTDQVGARNYVFYLVSPQKAWVLGVTPPEVGSILQQ
jgi:hypothetical protein